MVVNITEGIPETERKFNKRGSCNNILEKVNFMNKKQIEQEWKKLKFELFENKPKIDGPYPQNIVKRRQLLLFAQVHLSNIMDAKSRKDRWNERFETERYNKLMEIYYN